MEPLQFYYAANIMVPGSEKHAPLKLCVSGPVFVRHTAHPWRGESLG